MKPVSFTTQIMDSHGFRLREYVEPSLDAKTSPAMVSAFQYLNSLHTKKPMGFDDEPFHLSGFEPVQLRFHRWHNSAGLLAVKYEEREVVDLSLIRAGDELESDQRAVEEFLRAIRLQHPHTKADKRIANLTVTRGRTLTLVACERNGNRGSSIGLLESIFATEFFLYPR